ncbi:MAG: glycosyltransferase, partial [Bauldia litoralis]
LPLAPLEAMAHGLPSIGFSDCSGIPILIENGVTGLHVAREDQVESLAEGIGRLMQDPALRSSMGTAAKARYDTMFAPNLVLDRWESLIQQTAAARPQSFSIKAISGAIEARVAIQSALEVGPTRYFAGMSTAAEN